MLETNEGRCDLDVCSAIDEWLVLGVISSEITLVLGI
jgi:hypothetical protein